MYEKSAPARRAYSAGLTYGTFCKRNLGFLVFKMLGGLIMLLKPRLKFTLYCGKCVSQV
jgi:hypothetical protein